MRMRFVEVRMGKEKLLIKSLFLRICIIIIKGRVLVLELVRIMQKQEES
jgi:hypothetical protein